MKSKNSYDITNAIQEGMNEFHRLSGYPTKPIDKNENCSKVPTIKTKTFLQRIIVIKAVQFFITQIIKLKQ